MLLGDPLKIKSWYEVFLCGKKTLMEILMSFYEDREEEGEEDVKLRKKKHKMCLCLRV